jgi:hypothetical protein
MGVREVELLRARVAAGEQPWARAAAALSADTPRTYG